MEELQNDPGREAELQEQLKLLKLKVNEHRIESVWKKFTDAGYSPILIKGWATAFFYDKPGDRQYVDVDLVVSPEEFDEIKAFTTENQFAISVDLHKNARHLDSRTYEELFRDSVLKKCGDTMIRVPCDEDHLRILCVHWLNDGGAYKDKLWDIYYAVKNRRPDFDWDKCLSTISQKRRKWIVCAIGLAHKYLDLPASGLPFADDFEKIPRWVIRTVEKEWATDVRLLPLEWYLSDRKNLIKQIWKRFPPNAIQATIELNGSFNEIPRIFYQITNIFTRIVQSFDRMKPRFRNQRDLLK